MIMWTVATVYQQVACSCRAQRQPAASGTRRRGDVCAPGAENAVCTFPESPTALCTGARQPHFAVCPVM